jgi:hypothetical protein
MLANPFEKRVHFANTHFKILKVPTIVTLASQDKMIKEVDALQHGLPTLQSKNYEVFFSEAAKIPIFYEIVFVKLLFEK